MIVFFPHSCANLRYYWFSDTTVIGHGTHTNTQIYRAVLNGWFIICISIFLTMWNVGIFCTAWNGSILAHFEEKNHASRKTHWWVCNLHSVGTFALDDDVDDEEEEGEVEKRTPTVYFYIVQEIENRNENLTKFSITSGENTDSSKRTGVGSNVTKCLSVCMLGIFYVEFLFCFRADSLRSISFLHISSLFVLTILALHAISTCTFHEIISERFLF